MLTPLKSQISSGLAQLNRSADTTQLTHLAQYLLKLEKWNKAYNLTAIKTAPEMVARHLLDSLTLLEYVHGPRVIDVGTGGGLPSIPLAIMRPDLQFTLLDANGKKTRFLQQVAYQLQLDNVNIIQSRVEQYTPNPLFHQVLTRAYASLNDIINTCQHLIIAKNGSIIAQKSDNIYDELDQIKDKSWQITSYTTQVPGLDWPAKVLILRH